MTTEDLKLDQIRIDGGTQPRVCIDEQIVADYADELRQGDVFQPVIVFRDGANLWLADGFHRFHAHRRLSRETILAEVRSGTQRDAILFSVGANAAHGQRRSRKDKSKAVETMLSNPLVCLDGQGNPWSNMEIARRCHVSEFLVRRVRKDHTSIKSKYESRERAFTHPKTGKPTRMRTARIGGSSTQHSRGTTRIAKGAFRPQPFHGEGGPVPMRAISLPLNNPKQAARSMLSLYGEDYMRELAAELNQILQNTEGAEHGCHEHQA